MAYKRLSLTRGNDETYGIVFKTATGSLYNIKNWVVKFMLKTNYDLPDSEASLTKTVTQFSDTTSGTTGSAQVSLVPSDTLSLDPGEYVYEILATTNNNVNFTVAKGHFDLEWNVIKTSGTAGTA